jgi:hypothetical protein
MTEDENKKLEAGEFLWPGEAKAIATVIELGKQYGYGNLISRMRESWKLDLMEKYGLDEEAADLGTRV